MDAYKWLLEAVQAKGIFQRNKKPLEEKVLAILLYMAGLSYRAMTMQTGLIDACYRSVHYWVCKLNGLIYNMPKKHHRYVAIDETKLKVNGKHVFVWFAIDTKDIG